MAREQTRSGRAFTPIAFTGGTGTTPSVSKEAQTLPGVVEALMGCQRPEDPTHFTVVGDGTASAPGTLTETMYFVAVEDGIAIMPTRTTSSVRSNGTSVFRPAASRFDTLLGLLERVRMTTCGIADCAHVGLTTTRALDHPTYRFRVQVVPSHVWCRMRQ